MPRKVCEASVEFFFARKLPLILKKDFRSFFFFSAKKKFLCSNFQSPKVQDKEKWAVDVFRNWQATREKKSYTLRQPGSVFKVCKVLKKGWRACIASP